MNKKSTIYLLLAGITGLLFSCEKDEDKVYLLKDPVAPTLVTVPDLTLRRTNASEILEFKGTPVDPGFQASVTYFLEACASGNNFANVTGITSGIQDTSFKISVSDLNSLFLRNFPADQTSAVDFRIRSVLVADAGTGVVPFTYNSEIKTTDVTPYGLPRLDLIGSGTDQKIESAAGDGIYTGIVKMDVTQPFTLRDPDTGTEYGASGSALAINGSAISAETNGWYQLNADINALTYSLNPYQIGVVGLFTDWGNNPDHPMEYDQSKGYWYITIDLPAGPMKFRLNSKWDVNWGPGATTDLPANGGTLSLPNSNGDINITGAGNYTIHLTINGSSGSVTFIKN
ncbi:MAG: SusE domain-containing protein [Mangrovibacterium sp.]